MELINKQIEFILNEIAYIREVAERGQARINNIDILLALNEEKLKIFNQKLQNVK